jgi:hypothetical protein
VLDVGQEGRDVRDQVHAQAADHVRPRALRRQPCARGVQQLAEHDHHLVELVDAVLAQRDMTHGAEQVRLEHLLQRLAVPAPDALVVLLQHGAAGDASVGRHHDADELLLLRVLDRREALGHGLGVRQQLGRARVVLGLGLLAEVRLQQAVEVATVHQARQLAAQREGLLDGAVVVPDEGLQQVAQLARHQVGVVLLAAAGAVRAAVVPVGRGRREQEAALDQRVDGRLQLEGRQVAEGAAARDVRQLGPVALAAQEELQQVHQLLGEELHPLADGLLARHAPLELADQPVLGVRRGPVTVPEGQQLPEFSLRPVAQGGLQGHAAHGAVDCRRLPFHHPEPSG